MIWMFVANIVVISGIIPGGKRLLRLAPIVGKLLNSNEIIMDEKKEKFTIINDTKLSEKIEFRVTLKTKIEFVEIARMLSVNRGGLLRGFLLSYLSQQGKDFNSLVNGENIAIKQRQIHSVKYRIKKFWIDSLDFQKTNYISTGKLSHECILEEIQILEEWYNSLQPHLKKYVEKNMEGVLRFKSKIFFIEHYKKLLMGAKLLE